MNAIETQSDAPQESSPARSESRASSGNQSVMSEKTPLMDAPQISSSSSPIMNNKYMSPSIIDSETNELDVEQEIVREVSSLASAVPSLTGSGDLKHRSSSITS